MQKKRILPLLILLNTFISGGAFAATAVCDSYLGRPTNVNQTPRLGATTISIGADTPIGTVLHQVNFTRNAAASPWISCRPSSDGSTYNIAQYLALSAPPALVPGWTGQYAGALYQSGVSGIGFAIVNRDGTTSGQAVTPTPTLKWQTPIAATIFNFYYGNALS